MKNPSAEARQPRWTTATVVRLLLLSSVVDRARAATLPAVVSDADQKRSVQDIAASVDGKFRPLDSFAQVIGLSGIQHCLEHLERRMDGVEAAVGRMDDRLQSRLDKIYEVALAREARNKPSIDLERRIDAAAEKILARVGVLGARSSGWADDVLKRMERMERNLGELLGDVLQKMTRTEEKTAQMEERWTNRVARFERIAADVHDNLKEEWTGLLAARTATGNATEAVYEEAEDWEAGSAPTAGKKPGATSSTPETAAADTPLPNDSESYWRNVSTTLDDALLVGRKKFHELDEDIEMYTRKVLNAYQELLKESKGIEDYLNKVIDHDNQTRNVVREGFRKLFHQMKPLSTLEEILQSLRKKVAEMGSTVDTSFASLLVAQNTFIATCHRIQHQEPQVETKIYHLLQKMMAQVEERSSRSDCAGANETFLWKSFEAHRKDVGRAMHDLVWTVIRVGNQTALDLQRAVDQLEHSNGRQCPLHGHERAPENATTVRPTFEATPLGPSGSEGRDVPSDTTDHDVVFDSTSGSSDPSTEETLGFP